MKQKHSNQSGQAIIEMTIALVFMMFLILGIIFTVGLCIGNVDVLLEAKANADSAAGDATEGKDGGEITNWSYSTYKKLNGEMVDLPFLIQDTPIKTVQPSLADAQVVSDQASDSGSTHAASALYQRYVFTKFGDLPLFNSNRNPNNYPDQLSRAHKAANLIRATAGMRETSVATLDPRRSGGHITREDVQKMEDSFRTLFGVNAPQIDLTGAASNTVCMPAMKLIEGNRLNCN